MVDKWLVETDLSDEWNFYTRANVGEVFPDPVAPLAPSKQAITKYLKYTVMSVRAPLRVVFSTNGHHSSTVANKVSSVISSWWFHAAAQIGAMIEAGTELHLATASLELNSLAAFHITGHSCLPGGSGRERPCADIWRGWGLSSQCSPAG